MRRLLTAIVLAALAIGGIGCGSANSGVSEDDVDSKQKQMETATENLTGKSASERETRN
ncbi:MAG: hypothetical protein IH944_10155 [Armatimonadetes bacterium]|nr:hypothetical protein [Armatimonadota bacterium]